MGEWRAQDHKGPEPEDMGRRGSHTFIKDTRVRANQQLSIWARFVYPKPMRSILQVLLLLMPLSATAWVIDSGHGGNDDPGVSGCGTLNEASLTLDVAARLKDNLSGSTVLTRRSDQSLTWPDRIAIANQRRTDPFISLHAEIAPGSTAKGVRIYVLLPSLAELRLPSAPLASVGELRLRSLENVALEYAVESDHMATEIQALLLDELPKVPVKIMRGLYLPLLGVEAPSVMIGVGFLSNQEDCQRLTDDRQREQLAKLLAKALKEYKRNRRERS